MRACVRVCACVCVRVCSTLVGLCLMYTNREVFLRKKLRRTLQSVCLTRYIVNSNNIIIIIQFITQPADSVSLFHQTFQEKRVNICLRLFDTKIKLMKVVIL